MGGLPRGVCIQGGGSAWGSLSGMGVCPGGSAQGGLHPEGVGGQTPSPRDTVLLECILVEQIFTAADCLRCMNILFGPMMSPKA